MKPPCEIVLWYVIPAIRSELAKKLLKLGMKQKEVSELMDINQPAVSQYITDKRGSGICLKDNIKKMIYGFAQVLYDGEASKIDLVSRICQICKNVETNDILEQLGIVKFELGENCQTCL